MRKNGDRTGRARVARLPSKHRNPATTEFVDRQRADGRLASGPGVTSDDLYEIWEPGALQRLLGAVTALNCKRWLHHLPVKILRGSKRSPKCSLFTPGHRSIFATAASPAGLTARCGRGEAYAISLSVPVPGPCIGVFRSQPSPCPVLVRLLMAELRYTMMHVLPYEPGVCAARAAWMLSSRLRWRHSVGADYLL
ncbi:hypothetical protein BC834DRAFT_26984 [Gloeopeniophorella convolvens]|nr:hypothetical protein BC834DRAFT_26984 [Gloeopeniophorella convolvens]